MRPTITVQSGPYILALDRLLTDLRIGPDALPQVVRTEARLGLQMIIRLTPPKNLKQGKQAVTNDMGKAYRVMVTSTWKSEAIREAIERADARALQAILDQISPGRYRTYQQFTKTVVKRNRRGRTIKQKPKPVFFESSEQKAYLQKIQGNVGLARAGWNEAAANLGVKIPKWVARHGNGHGSHFEIRNSPTSYTIEARNNSVKIPGYQRTVDSALKLRAKNLNRNIDAVLKGKAKLHGFEVR